MNWKTIFICFMAIILSPAINDINATESDSDLELKGSISDEHLIRSLIHDVMVWQTHGGFDILFNVRCSVKVSIVNTDNDSLMYEKYIDNTQTEKQIYIDTARLTHGTYKLIFENTKNQKITYGYFEID